MCTFKLSTLLIKGKNRSEGILKFLKKRGKTVWPDQIATYKPGTIFNISYSWSLSRILNEPEIPYPYYYNLSSFMCMHVHTHVYTQIEYKIPQYQMTEFTKNKHKSYNFKESLIHPLFK